MKYQVQQERRNNILKLENSWIIMLQQKPMYNMGLFMQFTQPGAALFLNLFVLSTVQTTPPFGYFMTGRHKGAFWQCCTSLFHVAFPLDIQTDHVIPYPGLHHYSFCILPKTPIYTEERKQTLKSLWKQAKCSRTERRIMMFLCLYLAHFVVFC